LVRIKVLDLGPDHVPTRLWFDVSLAVASLGREGGIYLLIPLHLAARASVAREYIFRALVSEPRSEVAGRGVAGVGGEGSEARGGEVGRSWCLCAVVGAVGVGGGAELGEGEREDD